MLRREAVARLVDQTRPLVADLGAAEDIRVDGETGKLSSPRLGHSSNTSAQATGSSSTRVAHQRSPRSRRGR